MIDTPYTLLIRIPFHRSSDGALYCDPLWARDLRLHRDYIRHLSVCCPVVPAADVAGLARVDDLALAAVHALREDRGLGSVLRNLLPNFMVVWRATRGAAWVHSDGAGWAFPLSFYLLPIRLLRRFLWLVVIESSFWMLEPGQPASPRQRFSHHLHRILLGACLRRADARVFTQSFYRRYFLHGEEDRTLINPAVWVDEAALSTGEPVAADPVTQRPLSIFYPSRLLPEKGADVVLQAIALLRTQGVALNLTIMGAGPLEGAFAAQAAASAQAGSALRLSVLPPVAYGPDFFSELRRHDLVLVPTVMREQPRIVFDAFSQGRGVVGADTSGITDITTAENALWFRAGDAADMARVLASVAGRHDVARRLGQAGHRYLAGRTHRDMHRDRLAFLQSVAMQRRAPTPPAG